MVYHGLVAEVAIVPPNLGALVSGGSPHVRALLVGLEEESVIWRRFDHDLQLGVHTGLCFIPDDLLKSWRLALLKCSVLKGQLIQNVTPMLN